MPEKKDVIIEVCCGSVQDVYNAKEGGAQRVELNAGLFFGGLTPSAGAVREASRAGIPVMAMVRPREGGFCYTQREFETMLADAQILLGQGASGIVFGFLREDGALDSARCEKMMRVLGGAPAVFHRAIDLVGERWRETLDRLCALGVRRVLTSGQQATAMQGKETLRQMCAYAGGRIEILPGGGVRAHNVRELLDYTGCSQAHTSGSLLRSDATALLNPAVRFTAAAPPAQEVYQEVDAARIAEVVRAAGAR